VTAEMRSCEPYWVVAQDGTARVGLHRAITQALPGKGENDLSKQRGLSAQRLAAHEAAATSEDLFVCCQSRWSYQREPHLALDGRC
jgi:hypothetical protein